MTKKLLYIVNDADYFVSHRLDLAKAAAQNGYAVTVATRNGSKNNAITDAKFKTIDIPIQRGKSTLINELKTLWSLWCLFHKNNFDLIHAITVKTTLWAGLAGRLSGQKNIIFALTGLGFIFSDNSNKTKLLRRIIVPLLRFAMGGKNYRSIFQNPDDMMLFEKMNIIPHGHGILIKGSGVNPNFYTPVTPPSGAVSVLFVGRLLKLKGLQEYVAAAQIVKNKHPETRFLIAGDFDFNNPSCITNERMRLWTDKGIVEYLGQVSDIRDALKQSHIVCLPSYSEGIPKSLIEAASCALPIVTTDIPGCREIVHNSINGLLVPVQSVEPLAQALNTLITDEELRHKFGKAGRKLVENELSIGHVIEQTLSLYQSIVS